MGNEESRLLQMDVNKHSKPEAKSLPDNITGKLEVPLNGSFGHAEFSCSGPQGSRCGCVLGICYGRCCSGNCWTDAPPSCRNDACKKACIYADISCSAACIAGTAGAGLVACGAACSAAEEGCCAACGLPKFCSK